MPFAILASFVFVLAVGGCGGDDQREQAPASPAKESSKSESAETGEKSSGEGDLALARRPPGEEGLRVPAVQARIVAKSSPFGHVLFDANGQVVYVFERDLRNESNCTTADCVEAWPPVLTRREPSAGSGVHVGLVGTIRRADGTLQVTYNGRPLYFYEHEGPGEIKCHNVNLHGGLWWVVTPSGKPAT